jgi:hypothetical protein
MREPMSQQEHEAEVVESWREYFRTKHATDDKRHMDPRVALAQTFLNTIDRLLAENAQLRAALAAPANGDGDGVR